jgi:hypothetical protein
MEESPQLMQNGALLLRIQLLQIKQFFDFTQRGLLGCFTSLTLQLRHVYSGLVHARVGTWRAILATGSYEERCGSAPTSAGRSTRR